MKIQKAVSRLWYQNLGEDHSCRSCWRISIAETYLQEKENEEEHGKSFSGQNNIGSGHAYDGKELLN